MPKSGSNQSTASSAWRQVITFIRHPQETLILIVVSALDVAMTHRLLTQGDGQFVESNPFARFFLDHWGIRGMVYFKASMTVVVIVITQIIARQNSGLGRQVLGLATLIIVAVVIYSTSLHFQHNVVPPDISSIRKLQGMV